MEIKPIVSVASGILILQLITACSLVQKQFVFAPSSTQNWAVGGDERFPEAISICGKHKIDVRSVAWSRTSRIGPPLLPIFPVQLPDKVKTNIDVLLTPAGLCPIISIDGAIYPKTEQGIQSVCSYYPQIGQTNFVMSFKDRTDNCTIDDLPFKMTIHKIYDLFYLFGG